MAPRKAAKNRTSPPKHVVTQPVQITVPRDDRLRAITALADAVRSLSFALNVGTSINVSNCHFDVHDSLTPALSIDNGPETHSTNGFTLQ